MAASVLSLGLLAGSAHAQDPAAPGGTAAASSASQGQTQIITDGTSSSDTGGFFEKLRNWLHRDHAASDAPVTVPDGTQANTTTGVVQLPALTSPTPAASPPADLPPLTSSVKHVALVVPPGDGPAVVPPETMKASEPMPSGAPDFTTTAQQIPGTRQPLPQGQQGSPGYMESDTTETSPEVSVIPPGPDTVFRREREAAVLERIRQKALERVPPERVDFPDEPILPTDQPVARPFPAGSLVLEPNYTYYRRLLFEDINSERYGWDLGFVQPVVSTAKFLGDVVTLPYHLGTQPTRWYETDAGYCLPGDPVPYILYPPTLSVTGSIYEAGVVLALYAIFPG